jgi:hypothetical protein
MKQLDKWIKQSNDGKPPKWCSHIKFWSRPSSESDGIEWPPCGGWSLNDGSVFTQTGKWKYCPICGKPKPKNSIDNL